MSALVLDAGAFLAVERNDRATIARVRAGQRHNMELRTTGIVVAQVWRDPDGRQVRLARLLEAVDVRPVDEDLGREAGTLLRLSGTADPIDATVVLVARPDDRVLTSDPTDLRQLADALGRAVAVVAC